MNSHNAEIDVEPHRQEIINNLNNVRSRIKALTRGRQEVRLVAVSKLKPVSDILIAYEAGQRHFGENYLPLDIQWHFIGMVQSNKCKMLAAIPNLWAVETIEDKSKASMMNKVCASRESPLRVFVQVNTSGEETKNGIKPEECFSLLDHVLDNCENLKLTGLMTIGARHRENVEQNPDFIILKNLQTQFKNYRGIDLELSMGMSDNFEVAIKLGSTNVRTGSTIFGVRS
ncbi:10983_t:CDS:2 [Diversispora eburnea]|uniref:Pyridoxal phosphate homeostasis protein n=1 Tax=Diversispora eburnea TaxID=1213867 RepID=A0A9N9FSR9_9GLOM|nr:10983_t:CDS:2 [Diversispora eburnea]